MNEIEKKLVTEIAESLEGTCMNAFEIQYEYSTDELSDDELKQVNKDAVEEAVYQEVDPCSECGWWCNVSDLMVDENGELICSDCESSRDDSYDD